MRCHFRMKTTKIIARVNYRILTNSPYIWFSKFFRENSHYRISAKTTVVFIRKWQFGLKNEKFKIFSEFSLVKNNQIRAGNQGSAERHVWGQTGSVRDFQNFVSPGSVRSWISKFCWSWSMDPCLWQNIYFSFLPMFIDKRKENTILKLNLINNNKLYHCVFINYISGFAPQNRYASL